MDQVHIEKLKNIIDRLKSARNTFSQPNIIDAEIADLDAIYAFVTGGGPAEVEAPKKSKKEAPAEAGDSA